MANRQLDEEAIFHIARRIADLQAREDYLEQVCAGDNALWGRVEELLKVDEEENDFLRSASNVAPTVDQPPITERPGNAIGRYHLREQIGEGGMGIVFVAEQERPIQRKVALKVIKPGMDSKAVITRFDVERQALAMMDHPNIAKVLDAGTTESGRPYFVMELVRGVPITEYCDENKLSIAERLELFTQVCQAIQHAHQKGIIHRDIKPTNVLVTLHDDKPVIKVIDFGVAKAISQRLTEQTVYTGFAQAIGTPLYMSPEQAGASGLDIDTRTDVYSLGVLLYELLTGTTPFDKKELDRAAYEEVRRIIREQEPAKPSTKISTLGATLQSVSAQRRTDPQKLCRFVCGDLDWIVMKSLEKDRQRRYETASSLAADVHRFLNSEPVEARPPSTSYRLKKLAQRHKAPLATATVIALCLLSATVVSTWQAVRNRQLLEELRSEIVAAALNAVFRGSSYEAAEAIERARRAGAREDLLQTLEAVAFLNEGRTERAIVLLKAAVQENPDSVKAKGALFWAYWQGGDYGGADEIREQIIKESWSEDDYDNVFIAIVRQGAGTREQLESNDRQLDQLIDHHPLWGIAFSLRSSNLGEIGLRSKDIVCFDRAFEDLLKATQLIPENPFIQSEGLYVLTNAIELARFRGEERPDWLQLADTFAANLEGNNSYLLAPARAARYYYLTGETERALRLEEKVAKRGVAGGFCPAVAQRFAKGETEQLVEELRAAGAHPDPRICLATILARGSEEDREKALKIVEELLTRKVLAAQRCFIAEVLLLLGDSQRARKIASNIPESERSTQWEGYIKSLDYYAGDISEQELLEFAGPLSSTSCWAYYSFGIRALAEGDEPKAVEFFKKSRNTRMVSWWPYHWSSAFAEQLEKDDN